MRSKKDEDDSSYVMKHEGSVQKIAVEGWRRRRLEGERERERDGGGVNCRGSNIGVIVIQIE